MEYTINDSLYQQILDIPETLTAEAQHLRKQFVHQDGQRSLEQGMDIGWRLLRTLPPGELVRLNDRQIEQYITGDAEAGAAE